MTHTLFFTNIPPTGWLIIAVVVLILFGRGKISSLMGEVGKGITSFKRGIREGTEELDNITDDIPDAEITKDTPPQKSSAKKSSKKDSKDDDNA